MESPNTNGKPSSKRLLFDRRYGWVFDEWKDPSEEALAGGRGMFCIVPLAKAFLKTASNSINLTASSVVKVLEKPGLISPQELQPNLRDQINGDANSVKLAASSVVKALEKPGLLSPQ